MSQAIEHRSNSDQTAQCSFDEAMEHIEENAIKEEMSNQSNSCKLLDEGFEESYVPSFFR